MLDQIDQLTSADDIDSCGNRVGICHHRFFLKIFDPHILIHLQDAKTGCILALIQIPAYHSDICFLGNVVFQYFVIIHLVNRITGCDDHIRFMAPLQELQVLIDRICRSTIPVAIVCGDRRCKYIKTTLLTSEIPPLGRIQMFIQ